MALFRNDVMRKKVIFHDKGGGLGKKGFWHHVGGKGVQAKSDFV